MTAYIAVIRDKCRSEKIHGKAYTLCYCIPKSRDFGKDPRTVRRARNFGHRSSMDLWTIETFSKIITDFPLI